LQRDFAPQEIGKGFANAYLDSAKLDASVYPYDMPGKRILVAGKKLLTKERVFRNLDVVVEIEI
jgi:hypothetical protein